jgi:Xaa-Pro aminopeptidase
MNILIQQRVEALRGVLRREHLAAFIFPSTDPHNGEYVPDHWKGREWISGFTGSAGTAVVTLTSAALWTDSRYFIAAEQQLADTEFQLMKLKVVGTPTIAEWLGKELADSESKEVGIDGTVNSWNYVEAMIADLRAEGGLTLRTNLDPLQMIWTERPPVPLNDVEIHDMKFAGESAQDKIRRIRKELRRQHADGMIVAALDSIAWTLNLRGTDVHCNPVFVSYLLITSRKVTLFADSRKLTAEVKVYLRSIGVEQKEYDDVTEAVKRYSDYSILVDPDEINYTVAKAVRSRKIVSGKSPIPMLKAVKNPVEIEGFRRAMLRDAVAMVKFMRWLKPAVERGGETEMSVDRKLTALRAEQDLFCGVSFDTIAAYQEHGAIVHYEATPDTDAVLKPEGFLLLDSGAQYKDGTTDITRTIALGELTDTQKRVYTLVLKGHIQLELAKFPDGASGTQIDAFARAAMWREGINYLHGTGHGVGAYLNVHEGPHQIRMEWVPAPLRAGMTVTDEPGIYLAGRFGVRIENTLLIKDYLETEFGRFLQMEPLTLFPIDREPIIVEMLTEEELRWLDNYHLKVYKTLSPHLTDDADRDWLRINTLPLCKQEVWC